MQLSTKKKLAREFLLLILTAIIGLLAFLFIYPYNSIKQNQSDNLESEIKLKKEVADSLINTYHYKCNRQKWFFDQFKEKYDMSDTSINNSDKWWKIFNKYKNIDTLILRWNTIWDKEQVENIVNIGFESPKKLNEFIIKNSINDIDLMNKDSAKRVYNEIEKLKNDKYSARDKILDSKEQINISIWALIIAGIILFVLRYFIYAIVWSIKILKQK